MKTWIDLRDLPEQENFIKELMQNIKIKDNSEEFYIYSCLDVPVFKENIKIVNFKKWDFFSDQFSFLNKLKKDKNDFFITFSEFRPIFYNTNVYQIVPSLENILYPNLEETKFFKKYSLNYIIKSNFKKAKKIICYNKKTKKEINEKLNISDDKIEVINPFFTKNPPPTSKIDIIAKHSITGDFIIYDAWIWNNKNINRILDAIKEINKTQKLYLIIMWNDISKNIELRTSILNKWVKDFIIFAWTPDESELWLYYKKALWVIIASLYENFPENLSKAISFNTQIISSEIDEIKDIFWDKISYFSPISTTEMVLEIEKLIKNWKKDIFYDDIINKYSSENFIKSLLELIK